MGFNDEKGIVPEQLVGLAEKYPIIASQLNQALKDAATVLDCSLPITRQFLNDINQEELYAKAIELFNTACGTPLVIEETGVRRRISVFKENPSDFFKLVLTVNAILGQRELPYSSVLQGSPEKICENATILLDNDLIPNAHSAKLTQTKKEVQADLEKGNIKLFNPVLSREIQDKNIAILKLFKIEDDILQSSFLQGFIRRNETTTVRDACILLQNTFPNSDWRRYPDLIASYQKAITNAPLIDKIIGNSEWRTSSIRIATAELSKTVKRANYLDNSVPDWRKRKLYNALNVPVATLKRNVQIWELCGDKRVEIPRKLLLISLSKLVENIHSLMWILSKSNPKALEKRGITPLSIRRMIEKNELSEEIIKYIHLYPVGLYDIEAVLKPKTKSSSHSSKKTRSREPDYSPYGNDGW